MPHTIQTNTAGRRYEITYTGEVSLQERHQATAELFVKAAMSGIRRLLVDFSDVDTSAPGFDPTPAARIVPHATAFST